METEHELSKCFRSVWFAWLIFDVNILGFRLESSLSLAGLSVLLDRQSCWSLNLAASSSKMIIQGRWGRWVGTIIWGRRLYQIFPPKGGDYSRGAINRRAAIIRGNTVFSVSVFDNITVFYFSVTRRSLHFVNATPWMTGINRWKWYRPQRLSEAQKTINTESSVQVRFF